MSTCAKCPAVIHWALTPAGKKAPIDETPTADGNVLLLNPSGLGELLAVTLTGDVLELARRNGVGLRLSHFVSCPAKDEFRQK